MGRSAQQGDVLLVGSLPFQNADETFSRMGKGLGDHLFAIPDGEFGLRQIWVGFAIGLFQANPAIEVVEGTSDPEYKGHRKAPIQFAVTDPDNLTFDTTGYADIAIESYEAFKRERAAGNIADGVRFQVTFPGVGSNIEYFFEPASWPVISEAYLGAVKRDIDRISEVVPAEDLSIQFDICFELMDLATGDQHHYLAWPERTYEEKVEHHAEQFNELPKYVPDGALMGVHLCYGTWGGWPMVDMKDLSHCVRMANELTSRAPRRVDYVHMPATPEADGDFFAPLADLDIGQARLILGIVHFHDGHGEFERRFAAASKYAQNFGVASVCGFGRVQEDELESVVKAHVDAANALEKIAD
jgi:hypothetical protein